MVCRGATKMGERDEKGKLRNFEMLMMLEGEGNKNNGDFNAGRDNKTKKNMVSRGGYWENEG